MHTIYLFSLVLVFPCVLPASTQDAMWPWQVRRRRQSGENKCVLPPYPDNGMYSAGGSPNAKPGDKANSAQLHYSCNPGYRPLGNYILYCVRGAWSEDFPKCVRFCKLDPHPSVKYRCQATNDDSEDSYYRDCENYEPTGTVVRPQCNEPNYRFTGVLSHMRCVEGRWNYIAICQPECGTITPDGQGLIIDGRETKRGEFPWHAGIYRKDITPYKFICGGSLVSNNVIISAAHCFWDKANNKLRPATSFAVALGKLYRGWDNTLDKDAQKFDVGSVKVPARYQGASSNYQDDIAAVWLTSPAELRPHIRPVCLDFEAYFDGYQLREGNLGKVAGWGIKDLEGNPSTVLKVIELPYVRIERCIEESPPTFRPFITSDKICAGYTNGSALCQGDSGGGLVFKSKDRVAERFYLRGIVSTAPESEKVCNAFAMTSFTQISKHKSFIEKNTVGVDQTTIVEQDTETLCILPPYPENGNYSMVGSPNAKPGQGFYSVYIDVNCNTGFMPDNDVTPTCIYGRWAEKLPQCIPIQIDRCRRPRGWGDSHKCSEDFNSPVKRPCNEFEPNGTVVTRECSQKSFQLFNRTIKASDVAQCVNGVWDGELGCTTDKNCGSVTLPGGSEMPWVAAIYAKKDQRYICGATVVNSKYFLTAAHCVLNRKTESVGNPGDFLAAAGKYYPRFNDVRDRHAQTSGVSEIIVPQNYDASNFEKDVALIALSNHLKINTYVQPACVDATFNVNNINLKEAIAKTASWRLTNGAREISFDNALLRAVPVRIIDSKQCVSEIESLYQTFLTADKICAKDIVGQGICRGDSGLGLVYPVKGRYVLLGVISVGLSDVPCSAGQPIGFSSVYPYQTNPSS